jgi:hypothetical protein
MSNLPPMDEPNDIDKAASRRLATQVVTGSQASRDVHAMARHMLWLDQQVAAYRKLSALEAPSKIRLITGTREEGTPQARAALDFLELERPDIVIVGDATGVDRTVRDWSKKAAVGLLVGHWVGLGKDGGPERNEVMAEALRCFAVGGHDAKFEPFPGPASRGTWDAAQRCIRKGLKRCRE